MKIEKFERSHSAEKVERGEPLRFFNIHSVANYQKIQVRALWRHRKIFEKKSHKAKKGGRLSVEKCGKGPSASEWFFISCWRLQMRSK